MVTLELPDEQLDFELISHPRTQTARQEADALGADPAHVAKTVVLTDGYDGFVRMVVAASRRVDMRKACALLGGDFRLATEQELVGVYPMFELGAVPPFGGPKDPVVVDIAVADDATVVLEAGTHTQSLKLPASELVSLSRAWVADLSTPS